MTNRIFNDRCAAAEQGLAECKKNERLVILGRVIFFPAFVYFVYLYAFSEQSIINLLLALFSIISFLFLTKRDQKLQERKTFLGTILEINLAEIKALDGELTFPDGEQYINTDHPFSYDLDLFGKNSLFQVMNRTATKEGSEKLAGWLSNPLKSADEIYKRQEAVKELTPLLEWRQEFQASGKIEKEDFAAFPESLTRKIPAASRPLFSVIIYALPSLTLSLILLYIFNVIGYGAAAIAALIQLSVCIIYSYNLGKVEKELSGLTKQISVYLKIVLHIKDREFRSEQLVNLRERLFSREAGITEAFRKIASISKAYDQRGNFFWFLITNSLFMKDLHILHDYRRWLCRYFSHLPVWTEAIAEADALNSLANFSYLNPGFAFPVVSDNIIIKSEALGHPLIHTSRRVTNEFSIHSLHQFFIVTGANMAGKSTFLRTAGVNMVLASAGAPVCAAYFEFTPVNLFTSMRTTDNLSENTSYFHAELLRLKQMSDSIKDNGKTLIILDEIMKGTNSKDKFTGSRLFLEKIKDMNVSGIIATHDLDLGILADEYPDNFGNICFEIEITDSGIRFDYKLKSGITRNLNATYLLRKMELI